MAVQSFSDAHAQLFPTQQGQSPIASPETGGLSSFQQAHQQLIQQQQAKPTQPITVPKITQPVVKQPTQQPNLLQEGDSIFHGIVGAIGSVIKPQTPQPLISPLAQNKSTPVKLPNGINMNFFNPPASAQMQITPQSLASQKQSVQTDNAITSKVNQKLPQTMQGVHDLNIDPFSLKVNPAKAITDAWNSIKDAYTQENSQVAQLKATLHSSAPASAKVGKSLEALTSQAGFILSPITALFNAANDLPVIGSISRLITLPFTAVGEGSTALSNKIIDQLPISSQAKTNIKPGVGEIFALASQLALGHAIGGGKKAELANKFGSKDAATIVAKAEELAKEKAQVVSEKPQVYSPQEIRDKTFQAGAETTPVGKELLKASLQADQQGKYISIDTNTVPYTEKTQEAGLAGETNLPLKTTGIGETDRPSLSTAETLPSTTDTTKVSPSKVYVPGTTVEGVLSDRGFIQHYNDTTKDTKYLAGVLKDVGGDRKTISDVKKQSTAAEKIVGKLPRHPEFNETHINDLVRGTIIAKDNADRATVLNDLKQKANVTEVDDHTASNNPWGYDGINVTIKTPEGHLNEIQIHTPESIAVQHATHGLYEEWRREKEIPLSVFEKSKQLADKARADFREKNANSSIEGQASEQTTKQFDKNGKEVVPQRVLNTKETQYLQNVIKAKFDTVGATAKTPEDMIKGYTAAYKDILDRAGNDKIVLSALRTRLSKEMYDLAGAHEPSYKANYAILQTVIKEDPEMGSVISKLEDYVHEVDNKLLTAQKPEKGTAKPTPQVEKGVQTGQPTNQQPVGTGKQRASQAYKHTADRLMEEDPERFKDFKNGQPVYNIAKANVQAEMAAKFIEKDPQKAYSVAMGYENPPEGLRANDVSIALSDRAKFEKNDALMAKIETAQSIRSTRFGQENAALKGRGDQNSPHVFIQQVMDQRLKAIGKAPLTDAINMVKQRLGKTTTSAKERAIAKIDYVTEKLQKDLKKQQVKIQSAQSLLDILTCK